MRTQLRLIVKSQVKNSGTFGSLGTLGTLGTLFDSLDAEVEIFGTPGTPSIFGTQGTSDSKRVLSSTTDTLYLGTRQRSAPPAHKTSI